MIYGKENIKEDFHKWLSKTGIDFQDFRDWYATEYLKLPVGTIRRLIGRMNKIADDERLGPNRRLLATYQSSYWSAKIMGDTSECALLASIILGEFVNRNGFRLTDKTSAPMGQPLESRDGSKLELAAMANLKEAFSSIKDNLREEGFLPDEYTDTVQGE